MEKYLVDDYKRKMEGRVDEGTQKRRMETLELYSHKIGKDEIADILEISVETVEKYLTWLRKNGYLTQEIEDDIKREKARQTHPVNKKLTLRRAENLAKERDAEIRRLVKKEGRTIQEVEGEMGLTHSQALERFMALGLPIYTREELEERARKREESKEHSKTEAVVEEAETEEKPQEEMEEKSKEDSQEMEYVSSFDEIVDSMREYIGNRQSKKALDLAKHFLDTGDFLTIQQRNTLSDMVWFIERARSGEIRPAKESKEKEER